MSGNSGPDYHSPNWIAARLKQTLRGGTDGDHAEAWRRTGLSSTFAGRTTAAVQRGKDQVVRHVILKTDTCDELYCTAVAAFKVLLIFRFRPAQATEEYSIEGRAHKVCKYQVTIGVGLW